MTEVGSKEAWVLARIRDAKANGLLGVELSLAEQVIAGELYRLGLATPTSTESGVRWILSGKGETLAGKGRR